MTRYFKSLLSNQIITEDILENLMAEFSSPLDKEVVASYFVEIHPTTIDLLQDGTLFRAMKHYSELHNCSLQEAYNVVKLIRREMLVTKC